MEEARYEPAAPGAIRNCFICLGPLESPMAVVPCGHVFCHGCIQRQAATAAGATCPLCRDPIWATRPLQGQDNCAEVAPHRRHLQPLMVRQRRQQRRRQRRWRQRQQRRRQKLRRQWRRRQQRHRQQQRQRPGRGGRRRRNFSDRYREQSPPPVPIPRDWIVTEEWSWEERFWPGPWQERALRPHQARQEDQGSRDHVHSVPLDVFEDDLSWSP
ncbi:hypothetical protein WISP_43192 [Willisornis vidua]|uniref:RING-type domain-containing protein n=1 Tax=Willisornis vidua TaxID=1566151 RepID=A0ABQ9DKN4_9PASS|nr:hypothetical protein WISP_43192 [Willisornis vidua]